MVLPAFALLLVMLVLPEAAEAQKRRETAPAQTQARTFRDCPNCPEMVVVPAGEFLMGSPESERGRGKDEGPQRKVVFGQPFAVGKFEVTFSEWDACAAENGLQAQAGRRDLGARQASRDQRVLGRRQGVRGLARQEDRQALPAADRGGMGIRGARGDERLGAAPALLHGADHQLRQANYDANFKYGVGGQQGVYRQKTHGRGHLPARTPSACTTCTATSGSGWRTATRTATPARRRTARPCSGRDCSLRILRGGSWNYYPRLLRSAYRYATAPGIRTEYAGFRVARAM